ncbi:uncharacterized protein [Amphiura filiformis]|uniref:uncharacterized protein isoform X1 n=1 Tax=Amphiura filiformis TaxID=82378 RepID=UPI003B2171C5
MSLMPVACQEFCVDENNTYCTERLRSDYSIDCETKKHKDYTKASYFALLYIVGYPLIIFIVIFKMSPRRLRVIREHQELEDDSESNCTEESIVVEDEEETGNNNSIENHSEELHDPAVQNEDIENLESDETHGVREENVHPRMNNQTLEYPLYIRFLCAMYKPEYWYWDIVELSRKVVQTSLIVLFGSEDPFTLGATIVLSMLFIATHAALKPMKGFLHWLQMTSLVAIFLNLVCAQVLLVPLTDPSGYRQTAMAVFIILLNISVVLLAVGHSILILWRSVRNHGRACSCQSCLTIVTEIVSAVAGVSRRTPNRETPAAI